MSDPKRCQPPHTAITGTLHLIQDERPHPILAVWEGGEHAEWITYDYGGMMCRRRGHSLAVSGYRYVASVPSPTEIAALVAAARDIANNVHARIAVAQHKMAKLDAALAPFQPKDTPHA